MFAKRAMGDDVTFQLAKQGALSPEQVSAHILRYLKAMAEKRLREPVDEAVITVPAYFGMRAKQMTEKAAELAGLRVAQIAQEPVAAALMYTVGDTRPSLTIMTYDLGGGTFDVAVLEKRQGVISSDSIKGFDGDRFLGGYNFDKAIALWVVDQLCQRGYDLRLDHDNPADKVIFSKLMIYAERAKIGLSKEEIYEFQEPSTGITDHRGVAVTLQFTISRQEFEEMIKKDIDHTVDLCDRALEKAFPELDRVARRAKPDEIVMVGGSSRIPLVAARLEQEFLRKPKLVNPDLCVALGAGLIAGTRATTVGNLRLDPVPAEVDVAEIAVTGLVVPAGALATVEKCAVTLRALDESFNRTRLVGAGGQFAFDRVPLAEDARTDFVLSVKAPAGAIVAERRFAVTHAQTVKAGGLPPDGVPTNVLAKPISIMLADGLHTVAPERSQLPFEKLVRAKTRDTSGAIRIAIYEENNPLGEILIANIPETLPVGSSVEITLTVQENYQIRGRGYVPALAREENVVIDIPVRPQKSVQELRRDYELLSEKAGDVLAGAGRGALFGDARVKRLKERQARCEEQLRAAQKGQPVEPAAIQDCLDEIENLTREIGKKWEPKPSRDVFDETVEEARELLASAVKKKPETAQQGYDKQIEAIQTEAQKALQTENSAAWSDAYDKLSTVRERIEKITQKGGGDGPPPDPATWKLQFGQQLGQVEKAARAAGRYEPLKAKFDEAASSLTRIDPKSPGAVSELADWYNTKLRALAQELGGPGKEGIPERDKQANA
jgi:molecular chaperone DnaK (HSP70)